MAAPIPAGAPTLPVFNTGIDYSGEKGECMLIGNELAEAGDGVERTTAGKVVGESALLNDPTRVVFNQRDCQPA